MLSVLHPLQKDNYTYPRSKFLIRAWDLRKKEYLLLVMPHVLCKF